MENQTTRKNTIINYGLLTGGTSIIIALISYAMGNVANPGILVSSIGFLLPITLIVLGIRKFKSNNNDFLTWGEAVKVGVGIALIWAVLALGFQYILENFIDSNILEQKIEVSRQALEKWGMNEDMIEENIEKQRNQNPLLANGMALLLFAFIGFVVSAIAGAVMQKKDENAY